MLSGIGPQKQLESFGIEVLADLPVGENLQNHPALNINYLVKEEYQYLVTKGDPTMTVDNLYEYYTNRSGILAQYYISLTFLSTKSNPDTDWPNVALLSVPLRAGKDLDHFGANPFGARKQEWEEYYGDFFGKNYLYIVPTLERVKSFGYVRLLSSNPFVYPEINPLFLTHPQDYQDFVDFLKFVFFIYERSSIAKYILPHKPIPGCYFCLNQRYVYECDDYIKCVIRGLIYTSYHPVGTCRMGDPNRPDTVLDPRLRVKGFDGLRVCDASVMPVVTNGNTNAPSMMIGEKCADLIKEDHHLFKHFESTY